MKQETFFIILNDFQLPQIVSDLIVHLFINLSKSISSLWFGMLMLFTNLHVMEFQIIYLTFFSFFSLMDCFRWFWMGSLHKNIQLMLEFLKAPFLVLHFSYYTLMAFLMLISVLLLFMLTILLFPPKVIRYLICGNNQC